MAVMLGLLSVSPVYSAPTHPQELIESTAKFVIAEMRKDKVRLQSDDQALYAFVEKNILPHFDFEKMSRWVLGKYWRTSNAQERVDFIREFQTLLVRTYATSLFEYVDQEFTYLPFKGDLASGEVTVRTEVSQPGGFPVPIHYRLYNDNGAWKAYDVTIDDISLVTNYRASFGTEIRNGGIRELIRTLAKRNKENTK